MSGRPAGDSIVWAGGEVFLDGPFEGLPVKGRPPQNVIDRGFKPDVDFPAKWINGVLHDVTARVAALDLLPELNWDADDSLELTSSIKTSTALSWHPHARAYVVVQDDGGSMVVSYSPDAKAWTPIDMSAGTPVEGCALAISAFTGNVFLPEQTTGKIHRLSSPDLSYVASSSIIPNTVVRGCKPGPNEEMAVLIYGKDSVTNRSRLWTLTEAGGLAATQKLLGDSDIANDDIVDVAWRADRLVALSEQGRIYVDTTLIPGGHMFFGFVAGGATPDPSGGTVLTNDPQGISYDEVNGVFWMASNQGEIWASVDGVVWVPRPNDLDVEISGSILSHGGIWVFRGAFNDAPLGGDRIFYSTNLGESWEDSPLPLPWASICSEQGRRLVFIDTDGNTSRSRRVRG